MHVRLESDVTKYDADMRKAAAITARSQGQITTTLDRSSSAVRRMGAAQQAGTRTTNMFGSRMQQAGYQVQDFAVQVAGGQGAMRAFSQQAPQFLGAFGPAGAIAGAVISVGALAGSFLMSAKNAKEATQEIETYAEALARLRGTQEKIRFEGLSIFGKKEDLEKQLVEAKKKVDELFAYSNQNTLNQERERLFTALTVPQFTELDTQSERDRKVAESIEANKPIRARMAEIDTRSSDEEIEQTNIRLRQEQEKIVKLQAAIAAKGGEIAKAETEHSASMIRSAQERSAAETDFASQLDADLKKVGLSMEAHNALLDAQAESIRDSLDPLSQYRKELQKIEEVRSRLTTGEFDAATEAVKKQMVGTALDDFFGELDANSKLNNGTEKLSQAARQMGHSFTTAFEDAAFSAGNMGDVVNGLIEDIARMALRMAVINPILNGVFGGTSGWAALPTMWGGPKADGGPVSSGSTYLVGEEGPELFSPESSGTIIPNHRLSTGGGGDTYNFGPYHFGAGVSPQQLMPLLAMQERNIIGTLADAKRRRRPLGMTI